MQDRGYRLDLPVNSFNVLTLFLKISIHNLHTHKIRKNNTTAHYIYAVLKWAMSYGTLPHITKPEGHDLGHDSYFYTFII